VSWRHWKLQLALDAEVCGLIRTRFRRGSFVAAGGRSLSETAFERFMRGK
jgi:hypothetical protein